MKNEYRYRAHIRWGQYVIFTFFLLFSLLFFAGALSADSEAFLYLTIAISILLVGALLGLLYRRLSTTRISFDEQGIVSHRGRSETRIPFEEISKLSFPSISYTGGWIKIISETKKIRLTVVLKNFPGFLLELKTALDNRELSERYDRRKFFKFFKTATYADQSWDRFYSIFWKLLALSGLATILGLVFSALNNAGLGERLVWTWASFFWPIAVWFVAELLLARRLSKNCDEISFACPPRDVSYEKSFFRKMTVWGALIYLATSLILLFLIL